MSLRRFLSLAGFAIAASAALLGQSMPLPMSHAQTAEPEEIRELVSKYCRLDYEGARLNTGEWPKIQPLVWWKSNPDFTQADVISRYTVETSPQLQRGKYTVTVHYRLIGRFDAALGYIREPSSVEDVEYTVSSNNNGDWRIEDATPNFPHPSPVAMQRWLGDKVSNTADPAARKTYQDALRQLQVPSAPPSQ